MSQRQDSLTDQLETMRRLAVEAGCYDAADYIVRANDSTNSLRAALEQARAELSNVIAERDKLCVDFEAVKAELAKVMAERDRMLNEEAAEASRQREGTRLLSADEYDARRK